MPRARQTWGCSHLRHVRQSNPSQLWSVPFLPTGRIANTYQFHDNWTHIAGRHAWKLGVDVTQVRAPITMLINYNGSFQFADFAAFAANSPNRIRIASGNPYLDFRETDLYPYAADADKVTNRPGPYFGLTWSYYGQPANILHKITTRSQTGDDPLLESKSAIERHHFTGITCLQEWLGSGHRICVVSPQQFPAFRE